MNKSIISSFALVFVAAIWGFAFVVVKDSLDYIGPYWMVAIRFLIAAVFLALAAIPRFHFFTKKIVKHGIILGVFLFAAYTTQTIGCKFTTAGKNAFLTTIYVILVPILGWPILKKKPAWFVFLAAAMSLFGIGLLALGSESGKWYFMNVGDILTLVCGVFYALHIIFGAKYVSNEDVILLTLLQFATASFLGFAVSPFLDSPFELLLFCNKNVAASLLYLGLLSSLLAFLLQNLCLKYVPSALASLFLSLESVFGVLCSAIFLGERLTSRMATGCVFIFAAILIAEVLPNFAGFRAAALGERVATNEVGAQGETSPS